MQVEAKPVESRAQVAECGGGFCRPPYTQPRDHPQGCTQALRRPTQHLGLPFITPASSVSYYMTDCVLYSNHFDPLSNYSSTDAAECLIYTPTTSPPSPPQLPSSCSLLRVPASIYGFKNDIQASTARSKRREAVEEKRQKKCAGQQTRRDRQRAKLD